MGEGFPDEDDSSAFRSMPCTRGDIPRVQSSLWWFHRIVAVQLFADTFTFAAVVHRSEKKEKSHSLRYIATRVVVGFVINTCRLSLSIRLAFPVWRALTSFSLSLSLSLGISFQSSCLVWKVCSREMPRRMNFLNGGITAFSIETFSLEKF